MPTNSRLRPIAGDRSKRDILRIASYRLLIASAVFLLLTLAAPIFAQQPQFYGWKQPATAQRIFYPTPLRDLLFGRQRLVPTGPPVP